MSLQSALLGYLFSLLFYKTPMTPQENVVLQTIAVATGTMPLAAGFVGIIPALSLLTYERDGVEPIKVGWLSGIGWSLGVAFFGYVGARRRCGNLRLNLGAIKIGCFWRPHCGSKWSVH